MQSTEMTEARDSLSSVPVRVVCQTGLSVLVEWVDDSGNKRRGIIPGDQLSGEEVSKAALDCAEPYGIPWEEIAICSVTPAMIARELRRAGLWTLDDLRRRPADVINALQRAYGIGRAALVAAAERYQKESVHE